jgi:hypothetical protein
MPGGVGSFGAGSGGAVSVSEPTCDLSEQRLAYAPPAAHYCRFELTRGSRPVAPPRKPSEPGRTHPIHLRLPTPVFERIDAKAKAHLLPMNRTIVDELVASRFSIARPSSPTR